MRHRIAAAGHSTPAFPAIGAHRGTVGDCVGAASVGAAFVEDALWELLLRELDLWSCICGAGSMGAAEAAMNGRNTRQPIAASAAPIKASATKFEALSETSALAPKQLLLQRQSPAISTK